MRIESLTNLGEGIAREGETGWVVMIPHVIPGELVKCKVFRNHANYSEATLVGEMRCLLWHKLQIIRYLLHSVRWVAALPLTPISPICLVSRA